MFRKLKITFLCIVLCYSCSTNEQQNGCKTPILIINRFDSIQKQSKLLFINCGFDNDSLIIYASNKIVYNKTYTTSQINEPDYFGVDKNTKQITIELHNKNKQLKLDTVLILNKNNNYYFIEKENTKFRFNYSNKLPSFR